MPLSVGTRLGPYEIVAPLGAGGMGEVYRARDTKLGREVALKVLPEAFTRDAERMARFDREAQVLAALNHPNIATLYGVEEADGMKALVMELVEGPTLGERIGAGPMPLEEALPVAKQMAEAFEYAHDKGVVHRDLKPANVKVTPQGTVKILDFGLAKALEDTPAASSVRNSPTLSLAATRAGTILGTAAYMSPEQMAGKPVDKRADIWSYGVVLWEMLAGAKLFEGETVSHTLAAVLTQPVDFSRATETLRPLLRRCLERDARKRMRDIGEARLVLEDPTQEAEPERPAARVPKVWIAAAVVTAALVTGVAAWMLKPAAREGPVRKLEIPLPQLPNVFGSPLTLSPDGRRIAYVSQNRLWIRELDQFEAREVPGSAGAERPFWSPDSANVGYFAAGKLWRAAASGGGPISVCSVQGIVAEAGGAVWSTDGRIIFTTGGSGLLAVPANGGDAKPLVAVDPETEADFHHASPLPDGQSAVFVVHRKGGTDTLAVSDGARHQAILQVEGQYLANPAYSPSGHILYQREPENRGIWALPFSAARREATGAPFLAFPNAAYPSVAADGTLALIRQAGEAHAGQLVWLDRSGKVIDKVDEQFPEQFFTLSPDGKRLAAAIRGPSGRDIWIYDLSRGTKTRLTFGPESASYPVWSPGGDRITFQTDSATNISIAWMAADGAGRPEELVKSVTGRGFSFSPDGKFLVYGVSDGRARNLWYMPLAGDRKPVLLVAAKARTDTPAISPDGQYLAYASDESGRWELYLTRFPTHEGKWQVSVNGGAWPHWSSKGDRLFYTDQEHSVWEVEVALRPAVQLGSPHKLFGRQQGGWVGWLPEPFQVTGEGSRFLVLQRTEREGPAAISVVENWYREFRDRK